MATQTYLFLLLLVTITGTIAFDLTGWTAPALERRTVNAAGGWPANAFNSVNNTDCSAGNQYCFGGNCCPNELTCVGTGDPVNCVCCPAGSSCETTFQQDPICADSAWTLWNATTQGQYGGFFCCEEGQIGDTTGGCWPPGTKLDPTDRAISLAPGTSSGKASSTSSSTSSNSTSKSTSYAGKVKLPERTIIGIAVGVGLVAIIFAVVVGCCCWKCICKKSRKERQEAYNPSYEPYRQS
jgi:hypothetical protein